MFYAVEIATPSSRGPGAPIPFSRCLELSEAEVMSLLPCGTGKYDYFVSPDEAEQHATARGFQVVTCEKVGALDE